MVLLLERKAMTNLEKESESESRSVTSDSLQPRQHIKKQRHYFNKGSLVKAMVFPVVMYGCESWIITKLSTKELMLLNYGVGKDT